MKDSLKYGLIGILALSLIVNGYFILNRSNDLSSAKDNVTGVVGDATDASNSAVNNTKDLTKSLSSNVPPKKVPNPVIDATPVGPLTSWEFDTMTHDYGEIFQDSENEHIFKFTNTGNEPLIISKAKGSCGCTVPEYPTYPIKPGESNEIKVVYKPGKQKDKQSKTVTLTTNTEPSTTVLRISANVSPVL